MLFGHLCDIWRSYHKYVLCASNNVETTSKECYLDVCVTFGGSYNKYDLCASNNVETTSKECYLDIT